MTNATRTAALYSRRETITSIETTIAWFFVALNMLSRSKGASVADAVSAHARAVSA